MKKVIFYFFRAVTVVSTLFWAAYCFPLVAVIVGMYTDDALGLDTWQFLLILAVPCVVGLLTALLAGKLLPKLDLILSVLLPPALFGAGYGIALLNYALYSTFGNILTYLLGGVCFAAAANAVVYFIRNAKKARPRL